MDVLLTANFILAVDFSILNVALCAAGFTLFLGRVADLFGRKKLFLVGMVLFGVASLVGGLAQFPALLLAARVGQGLATAMVTPATLSLMATMFPEGPARSKTLGLNSALMAAGFTAGAVLGGLLTGSVSWSRAFFTSAVVAVIVLVLAPVVFKGPAPQGSVRHWTSPSPSPWSPSSSSSTTPAATAGHTPGTGVPSSALSSSS